MNKGQGILKVEWGRMGMEKDGTTVEPASERKGLRSGKGQASQADKAPGLADLQVPSPGVLARKAPKDALGALRKSSKTKLPFEVLLSFEAGFLRLRGLGMVVEVPATGEADNATLARGRRGGTMDATRSRLRPVAVRRE